MTPEAVEETPAATPEKELSKEEKELEQKMVKVIDKMPASVQDRFKTLHMFSDERSKINDLFEAEVKKLTAKMNLFSEPKKSKKVLPLTKELLPITELVTILLTELT